MGLQQDLDRVSAEFRQKASPERVAVYEEKVEDLKAQFAQRRTLGVGDRAPLFELPGARGKPVSLLGSLKSGPVVLTFYRGGWCPYCNLQLAAYQRVLPEIEALGARFVAVSPQTPDASLSTAEKNALGFDVLSDKGNVVAQAYGLVYSLPTELREMLAAAGKALPDVNGEDSWELPVPATFVIAGDGRVALADVQADHRIRLDPAHALRALRSLAPARA